MSNTKMCYLKKIVILPNESDIWAMNLTYLPKHMGRLENYYKIHYNVPPFYYWGGKSTSPHLDIWVTC